jgi:protoheme IX farnesyltransferase
VFKAYSVLTKSGIILFSLVSALAGYAVSYKIGQHFDPLTPVFLLVGLYFVSAGAFALNQAQEWQVDARMNRTKNRPVAKGLIQPWQAYLLGAIFCVFGLIVLYPLGPWPAGLSLLTVFLYNVVYTMWWKQKWAFGAVPGAIPGAMPVVIGYSVNSPDIFSSDCVYLFLVLFLWQMPHFWCLAIRFKEDYKSGGIPVLPVSLGVPRTMYHIGLYVFSYVGVALAAPWFLHAHILYVALVLPISMKVLWEFFKYLDHKAERSWLPFFLWVNFSLIVYLAVPVMDKWLYWMVQYV